MLLGLLERVSKMLHLPVLCIVTLRDDAKLQDSTLNRISSDSLSTDGCSTESSHGETFFLVDEFTDEMMTELLDHVIQLDPLFDEKILTDLRSGNRELNTSAVCMVS